MRRLLIFALCVVGIAVSATTAGALTILNTNNADGSANYVGSLITGAPANPDAQATYITYLINLAVNAANVIDPTTDQTYTRSDLAGPFPSVVTPNVQKQEYKDGDPTTIVATAPFKYLIGKFDGGNGGSLVWYFDGVVGETYQLPTTFANKALSQITMFDGGSLNVPDGGTTVGLLGLAMLGVGMLRSRLS